MKSAISCFTRVGAQRTCAALLAVVALASVGLAQTFTSGEKGKVKGTIISRKGDLVKVQDEKTGSLAMIRLPTIRKFCATNPRCPSVVTKTWTSPLCSWLEDQCRGRR